MPVPDKRITPTQYFAKGWDGRDCEHAGMDGQCMCDIIKADREEIAQESQDTIPCNQGSLDIVTKAITSAIINEEEFIAPEIPIDQLK